MFTGIIEEVGVVREAGPRLAVEANKVVSDSEPGSSISVNGVCLTVVDVRTEGGEGAAIMSFDLSPETLARSSLGRLAPGDPVNLERSATLLTRLGGHLVLGHVDAVGEIAGMAEESPGVTMTVKLPDELRPYVVEKGSIAVEGISLTVTRLSGDSFGVALVPFTLDATTLGAARPGDRVNLEVDVVAKYVEALMGRTA